MPSSARLQDQNGYLFVKGCPIASSGIFQYSAAQVGLPGDPNRIVNVYRPPEAVQDSEYIASLQVIPLINDHEMLSGFAGDTSSVAPEDYGLDGVLFDVLFAEPWVRGDLKIFTRSMQADLSSGKKDLSLGYTCDFEVRSGTIDGQSFEVVQINMRGNHIALVEVGRVPGARVLDGKRMCFDALSFSTFSINGGFTMRKPTRKALDSNVVATLQAQLKALLPTFEQFLSQEAAEPAHAGGEGAAAGAQAANPAAGGADPAAAVADPNAGGQAAGEAASAAMAQPAAAGGETGTGEVASEGASAGGEGAAMATGSGEQGEGESDGGNPNEIIAQVCELLKQLGAAMGGGQEAAPAAAAGGDEGGGDPGAEGGESTTGEAGNGESTEDALEGLNAEVREGADEGGAGAASGEGGQGHASAGPAAGKHTGADTALRRFYADLTSKTRFVDRLSKVVGAFDGALDLNTATSADVAAYGVKALKIKCAKGQESVALDAYLTAHEKGRAESGGVQVNPTSKQTADSAEAVSVVSEYLKKVS